jgi:hypothetical protein
MIDAHARRVWSERLRAVSSRILGVDPAIPQPNTFTDERGNQLEIDEPLFAALRGEESPVTALGLLPGDVALWRGVDPRAVLIEPHNQGPEPLPLLTNYDPMGTGGTMALIDSSQPTPQTQTGPRNGKWVTIEVLTERELCALHALHRVARDLKSRGDLEGSTWAKSRCTRACMWLVEHLQPDNATNYPWGLHVMLLQEPTLNGMGDHYAQTLLHNCQVGTGRGQADARSAWILWDAANELAQV